MGVRNNVGSMSWVYLAQGGIQRPVLMIIVMNLCMQEKTRNHLPSRGAAYYNCYANCGACGLGSLLSLALTGRIPGGEFSSFFCVVFSCVGRVPTMG